MKKNLLLAVLSMTFFFSYGKKVKFAVDMTGQVLSPNGIHVTGDFQVLAGFPADWESNTTLLTQEGSSTIYSTILDIPAFAKYEYKYVNGDQFYECEFVPVESRVGYNFVDNRWIYVDSLANDTTFVGAIVFAANAPAGKNLLRLYVDMQQQIINPAGIHVAGDFQGWDPSSTILYSFIPGVYEVIAFVDPGTSVQYKFYNGNTSGDAEIVPAGCENAGNREILSNADILLPIVCFSSCVQCIIISVAENIQPVKMEIYPNPSSGFFNLKLTNHYDSYTMMIKDVAGRLIRVYPDIKNGETKIETGYLNSGIYLVSVYKDQQILANSKLVIQ